MEQSDNYNSRRKFLKSSVMGSALLGISSFPALAESIGGAGTTLLKMPSGQKPAIGMAAPPIPTVRVGFIGVGNRGWYAVRRYTFLEGVEIKAICDINEARIDLTQKMLKEKGLNDVVSYTGGPDVWKKLVERNDIDLIYIATPWLLHTPMAVYSMNCGKHAALEVPAAVTIEQCWDLVNTSEKTRRHCMMLENCCYDEFEMATLNMAQQGVFGEIYHGEGAYIHRLNELCFGKKEDGTGKDYYEDQWLLKYNTIHTGSTYPTHGIGPIAQIMNINRGDKFEFLTSTSSNQYGITKYAQEKYGIDSPQAKQKYMLGDINTTVIKTHKGKTMMIQHDVTSPRPYSRIHLISGTKGIVQKWPVQGIALEPDYHHYLKKEEMDELLVKYQHPQIKKFGETFREISIKDEGSHGIMDYLMEYRLIYCLRNGLPLDMDVYDAASWSSIIELSEKSVLSESKKIDIPDFTRGEWNKRQQLEFAEKS
jgi:predicted dehydrogenase